MPKAYGDLTERLLKLPVGRSCVAVGHHPDRCIKTAKKHEPSGVWTIQTVDGGKIVTRVR
jgi:hypothetical protein